MAVAMAEYLRKPFVQRKRIRCNTDAGMLAGMVPRSTGTSLDICFHSRREC